MGDTTADIEKKRQEREQREDEPEKQQREEREGEVARRAESPQLHIEEVVAEKRSRTERSHSEMNTDVGG